MNKKLCLCLLLNTIVSAVMAQNICVRGKVFDAMNLTPLSGATLVVKDTVTNHISTFTNSLNDGQFILNFKKDDINSHLIQVSLLGYKQQYFNIIPDKELIVKMTEEVFVLDEVTVKVDKIVQRRDTTSYLVSSFATQKDRTIGDVLANMPGINVASNGRITYNGEAVNKFYIEGIDLLDGKYNIATNNLSYNNIAKVEVIENHQSIKAMEDSGLNTETAINLKLKDDAKAKWNGNLLSKAGFSPALWDSELFIARFATNMQSLTTLKSNNIGKDIANEATTLTIDDLLYMQAGSDVSESLKSLPYISTNIEPHRTCFNQTHTFSNSNMWKLSEMGQLKSQIIFTDNRNDYDQFIGVDYFLQDNTLHRETAEISRLKQKTLQVSLSAIVDKSEYYLSDELKYNADWEKLNSKITGDFSNNSIADINTHHLENRLKFVKRIGKNYLRINSINRYKYIPEVLNVYAQEDMGQEVMKKHFFTNTHINYAFNLKRWTLGANSEIFGSFMDMNSGLMQSATEFIIANDLSFNYWGGRFNPEITYQYEGLKLIMKMPVAYYHFFGVKKDNNVYICPDFYLRWKITPRWMITLNGAVGSSFTGNPLYYKAPILTDYRSLYAGFINLKGKDIMRVGGRISYNDPSNMLFVNASITRTVENTNRTIVKQVTSNGVVYTYVPGDDPYSLWFSDGNISKGIDFLNGKADLHLSYQQHTTPLVQNTVESLYNFGAYQADLTLTSNITSWLNLSYKVGYRQNFMNSENINSITHNIIQNADLSVFPTENLTFRINAEAYNTQFDLGQKKNTFIADLECIYRYKQIDITASVTNLFNQHLYAYTLYGDLSNTSTNYAMRGREFIVGVNWYF